MGTTQTAYPSQRKEFGIHSLTAINRTTKLPYGTVEILGDATVAFEASSVDLRGGSSLYPRATEINEIDSNVSFNLRTFPDWVFEVWMAAEVTTTAASATSGTISALTNEKGTSVFDATTGIATATLKTNEEDNLKMGTLIVEATSATAVDVYYSTSLQFARGTDLYYDNDLAKITTSPLTVVASSAVEIPGTGVELNGGSGVIALVTGDVAIFTVAPPHNGISDIVVGKSGVIFPEHEIYIYGKERGSGEKARIRCYKAQSVSGMSYPFSQSDFAQTDVTLKLLQDQSRNAVAEFRFVDGTG